MPRDRAFFLVLLTFIAAGVAFGMLREPASEEYRHAFAADLPDARAQAVSERLIRHLDLGAPRPAGERPPGALERGTASLINAAHELYVFDWPASAIKRYAADGTFLTAYQHRPDGPAGGAARPSDFALGPDGELWVAYRTEKEICVFTAAGETRRVHRLDVAPERLAVSPDGRFVVLSLGRPEIFGVYRDDGTLERRFGRPIDYELQEPILVDGSLAAGAEGGFVYAPFFYDHLYGFDFDGELRYRVETVAARVTDLPPVLASADGRRIVLPGTPWRTLDVNVLAERLYVLTERESKRIGGRLLDVYQARDGIYLESVRLPDLAQSAHLAGDGLRTVRDGKIWIWE